MGVIGLQGSANGRVRCSDSQVLREWSLECGPHVVKDGVEEGRTKIEEKKPAEHCKCTPASSGEEIDGSENRPGEEEERAGVVWKGAPSLACVG